MSSIEASRAEPNFDEVFPADRMDEEEGVEVEPDAEFDGLVSGMGDARDEGDASHVGEVKDDIWRAQHRADNIFGKSVVEEMKYYGLFKEDVEVKPKAPAPKASPAESKEGDEEEERAPEGGEEEAEAEVDGDEAEAEVDGDKAKAEVDGAKDASRKTKKVFAARVVQAEMNNALMQMVRELIANCADLVHKDDTFRRIRVSFNAEDGSISVRNDGKGMPVGKGLIKIQDASRKAAYEQEWSPTLLLARFGCSSNYDDSKVRMTAGKNGLGAKAVFAWSTKVVVTIVDSERDMYFRQIWKNGMRKEYKPTVRPAKGQKGYTDIRIWPNYEKLVKLSTPLTEDQVAMLRWCVWECCTVLPPRSLKFGVTIDGIALRDHSAEGVVAAVSKMVFSDTPAPPMLKHEVEWESTLNGQAFKERISCYAFPLHTVKATVSDYPALGFVNGITCPKGSHRVRVQSGLMSAIQSKVNNTSSVVVQNSLMIVPCAMVNQPAFSGQTKDELASKIPHQVSFASINISPLVRSGYIQHLKDLGKKREGDAAMSKLEVSKTVRADVDVKGYEGAMHTGKGTEDKPCFLFVTEGLSAQNCARNVIARLPADTKRRCGSYALRGKLINSMSNPPAKVWSNEEIKAMVKIVNLDPKLTYATREERASLRYHRLVLWTDADTDGGHIAWLVFLFVYTFWPRLAEAGFVQRFVTPLLKITSGDVPQAFYSEAAHDSWLEKRSEDLLAGEAAEALPTCGPAGADIPKVLATADMVRRALDALVSKSAKIKYYKGLGRLMKDDEADLARKFDSLCIRIDPTNDGELIRAIGADGADERRRVQKERSIRPPNYDEIQQVSVSEFVDGELLPYMRDANLRQIPGVDGFSESSRMVIAYFYSRNKADACGEEEVVARLAARIAADMDYHHGETSMSSVITTMAQDFAGKNNVNLLCPNGQFGTRVEPQAAAPRYTNTAVTRYLSALFPPQDYASLPMNRHGTVPAFIPGVMPMVLVNGSTGIGYGHSSDIPSHHPMAVLDVCRTWCATHSRSGLPKKVDDMNLSDISCDPLPADSDVTDEQRTARAQWREDAAKALVPWVRGLTIQPKPVSEGRFESRGRYEIAEDGSYILVTELPVGVWSKAYKENVLAKLPFVKSSFMDPLTVEVRITVNIAREERDKVKQLHESGALMKTLKLIRPVTYNNMKMFDRTGNIRAFASPVEIVEEFARARIWVYGRRKVLELRRMRAELALLESRAKFLEIQVRDESPVEIRRYKEDDVFEVLEREGVPKVNGSYGHLMRITVWNLTKDKMEKTLQEVAECRRSIAELEAKTLDNMWLDDLDRAEKALKEHWVETFCEPDPEEAPLKRPALGGKASAFASTRKRRAKADEGLKKPRAKVARA